MLKHESLTLKKPVRHTTGVGINASLDSNPVTKDSADLNCISEEVFLIPQFMKNDLKQLD